MKMQITHGLITWPIRHDLIISEILLPNDFAHHSKRLCTKNVLGRAKRAGVSPPSRPRLLDLRDCFHVESLSGGDHLPTLISSRLGRWACPRSFCWAVTPFSKATPDRHICFTIFPPRYCRSLSLK